MKRLLVIAGMAALLTGTTALAQAPTSTPSPPPKTVTIRPGLSVPDDQPLVLWVGETIVNERGQFAGVEVYARPADAPFTRLTPCDDLIVACAPIVMRVADVSQGDTFFLDGGH